MITDIKLQNFRSYTEDSFEFSKSVNIIVGPNASGKTNLLESILVISGANSYRVKDSELISHNKPWSRLEALVGNNETRVLTIKKDGEKIDKQHKINDRPFKRLSLDKTLPVVLFEPTHIQLLTSSPELRRQFLDGILDQTTPGFTTLRKQYKRSLIQRNYLLKNRRNITNDQLFVWNVRLSEYGQQIVEARTRVINKINQHITDLYNELSSNKYKVIIENITLATPEIYATELIKKLESHKNIDIERGFTSYGPHREDIKIHLNGHSVTETASRGEIRTLILVLKIVEALIIEESRETKPILLLDDVFSELDGKRRQSLIKFLQPYQTFITTTDADVILHQFVQSSNFIAIK